MFQFFASQFSGKTRLQNDVRFIEWDIRPYLLMLTCQTDFMSMKFFGWLLRHCGAFYIRRSFASDRLYWAVFTEYIQTQLRNGDAPLQFFVEGTRSRTNKSYIPKTGRCRVFRITHFSRVHTTQSASAVNMTVCR